MEDRGFAPPRGPVNNANSGRSEWKIPTRARWYPLYEEDEEFQLWFDNLARGSPTTAIERARVLYRFLGLNSIELGELTDLIKSDVTKFERKLMAFVGKQEDKGYAPGTIENYLKSVRSWANWHGVELVRKIKISNRTRTPTLDDEEVPTPQQVLDIRGSASIRGRICVGGLSYAGFRPEVLGHQYYHDGLKLGDLSELDIESLSFKIMPTIVEVRPELSKAGHKYRTFFPKETCRDIIAYLEKRLKSGEELTSQSPLVVVSSSQRSKGWRGLHGKNSGHIVSAVVTRDIRSAMRPTYPFRPYILRSFFSTRLLMAVSDGVLNNNYRIYWMGHKGEMSARYSTNKSQLPNDLIENMREAYKRSRRYLLGDPMDMEDLRKRSFMDVIKAFSGPSGSENEIEKVFERSDTVDEAIEEISSMGMRIIRTSQPMFRNDLGIPPDSGRFIVVNGNNKLAEYLKKGLIFIRELTREPSREGVEDEIWVDEAGKVYVGDKKIVINVRPNGVVEFRGPSIEIDQIMIELERLGVFLEPVEKGEPRYLLKYAA
jgi:integrase